VTLFKDRTTDLMYHYMERQLQYRYNDHSSIKLSIFLSQELATFTAFTTRTWSSSIINLIVFTTRTGSI